MGMRVGFEEILDLNTFGVDWEEDWEKGFEMKQFDFEKTELFRALKDKGIRILEKGIRIT